MRAKHYVVIELDTREERENVTAYLTTIIASNINHKEGKFQDKINAMNTIYHFPENVSIVVKED